jgi:hypothetical protein
MPTEKTNHLAWSASPWAGLAALTILVLASVFYENLFRDDYFKDRAYTFGGIAAGLAALAIVCGVRDSQTQANRAGAVVGTLLGGLALLLSALFIFGTMLVGG